MLVKVFSSLKAASATGLLALGRGGRLFFGAGFGCGAAEHPVGRDVRSAVVVEHERLKLRRRPWSSSCIDGRHGRPRARSRARGIRNRTGRFSLSRGSGRRLAGRAGPDADRDVKFLHDLVEHFVSDGSIDPRKIYLIGESSGGAFAYRAACAGVGRPVAGLATLVAAMPADLANCAQSDGLYRDQPRRRSADSLRRRPGEIRRNRLRRASRRDHLGGFCQECRVFDQA